MLPHLQRRSINTVNYAIACLMEDAWQEFLHAKMKREERYLGKLIRKYARQLKLAGYSQYPYLTNPHRDFSDSIRKFYWARIAGDKYDVLYSEILVSINSKLAGRKIKIGSRTEIVN